MSALKKLQAALSSLHADGMIISSELNQRYLSGFDYSDGYLLVTPTRSFLLADFRYAEAARAQTAGWEILRPEGTMTDELKRLIAQEGLTRVALEDATLSCADYQRFSKIFEGCTLCTGASELLKGLRAIKSEAELAIIAEAQSLTDRAFAHILDVLANRNDKMTERDIALELEFFMRKNGAEATAFDTIAVSGSASSLPHGVPRALPLQNGFLTMDFGAKVRGYCSDMTRTVVLGRADEEMKRVYHTVLSAQRAALDELCEGISCRDADEVARRIIREAGYGQCFGHSLGHGVGMYIHESPSLSPRAAEESVLVRGNVVTVEPGIYLEGKYGCRIEDMVAITHDGTVHNFTKSPKELIEL